jgi:glucose/arabinose dehydrogenase/cytochrome c2
MPKLTRVAAFAAADRLPLCWVKRATGLLGRATQASLAATLLALVLPLAGHDAARADDAPTVPTASSQEFWVEQLADGLNFPWSMAWLPNGDLLIVEKFGGIRTFHDGKLKPEPLKGVPEAYKVAQNGLLDIALDPDFAKDQRIFLTFTEGTARANRGALFRARLTGDALVDGKVIFRTKPDNVIFPLPLSGRLLFLPDKTLLLSSTDDHARRHLVRLMDNHLAKILRLDRDGVAPPDNPFVGKPGVLAEIYAIGTRAPLGLVRDPRNGSVWEVENGPKGGDELNLLKAGGDYGWPITTYGTEYTGESITELREAPGIESPITYWVPSIAPSSLALSYSNKYPQWQGDFFVGALIAKHLRRVRVRDGKTVEQEVLLKDLNERIRDVRQGPDGLLYVLTDHANGRLLRLQPGKLDPANAAREAKAPEKPQSFLMGDVSRRPKTFDLANGKQLFEQRCMGCHSLAPGAAGGAGPALTGVFGRKAGSTGGYAFSKAMHDSAIVWTENTLDYFLASPQDYITGTSMTAPPLTEDAQRWNLIAYLKSVLAP